MDLVHMTKDDKTTITIKFTWYDFCGIVTDFDLKFGILLST